MAYIKGFSLNKKLLQMTFVEVEYRIQVLMFYHSAYTATNNHVFSGVTMYKAFYISSYNTLI